MLEAVLITTAWPSGPPASLTNRLRMTFSFNLSSAPPITMTGPGVGMASVEREEWSELTGASLDGGCWPVPPRPDGKNGGSAVRRSLVEGATPASVAAPVIDITPGLAM